MGIMFDNCAVRKKENSADENGYARPYFYYGICGGISPFSVDKAPYI